MTIAIVSNAAWGVRLQRADLIRFLVERGQRVVVLCPLDSTVCHLVALGAKVVGWPVSRAGLNPLYELIAMLRLRRALFEIRPDVVLNFTPKGVIYGSLAARSRRRVSACSVITGLGSSFTDQGLRFAMLRRLMMVLYRFALRGNILVLFQNADDRDAFVRAGAVRRVQTEVVGGSGVDLHRFTATSREATAATGFLMVARLLREKGVMEYCQAAAALQAAGASFRAELLGPFDPEKRSGLREADLRPYLQSGAVTYLGTVRDVRPYLDAADVFVLPSYREGTPRATLEALAMAKPVITTAAPGCRETVDNGRNGILVPIRDPTALAAAMQRLIGKPDLLAKMGAHSRKLAEVRYDVDMVNDHIWRAVCKRMEQQR